MKVGLQALLKLRTDLYAYLQSLSLKYHDARRSADSSFRVAYDSQAIQTIYNKGFTNIFGSVITLVGIFVIMLQLDWQLTLALVRHRPPDRRRDLFLRPSDPDGIDLHSGTGQRAADPGAGRFELRSGWCTPSGARTSRSRNSTSARSKVLQANLRLTLTNVKSALVISTLTVIGTAAMYYLGTLHVLAGTLTLGSLLVFSAYLLMLYQPLEALTYTAWAMEGATAGARRCFEVLDREDDVRDSPGARRDSRRRGRRSPLTRSALPTTRSTRSCDGIDLTISPNQIVALVGGTGAGKSTLLSLVPRFYDPSAGVVSLDGRDVREITKEIAPRTDRDRPPGHAPLFHHHPREHRLRPSRSDRRGDPRSGAARAGG